jgi:hypothetical protein
LNKEEKKKLLLKYIITNKIIYTYIEALFCDTGIKFLLIDEAFILQQIYLGKKNSSIELKAASFEVLGLKNEKEKLKLRIGDYIRVKTVRISGTSEYNFIGNLNILEQFFFWSTLVKSVLERTK